MMSMRELIANENSIAPELLVFVLGGTSYALIEILFRGHTHWSMVLTGGACVVTFYILLDWLNGQPLIMAGMTGAAIITLYEFMVGCIVNLRFGWNVWDYTDQPGNLLGQVCPVFSAVWFGMCCMFFGMVRILS